MKKQFLQRTTSLLAAGTLLLTGLLAGPAAYAEAPAPAVDPPAQTSIPAEEPAPAAAEGRAIACISTVGLNAAEKSGGGLSWEPQMELTSEGVASELAENEALSDTANAMGGEAALGGQRLVLVTSDTLSTAELIARLEARGDVLFAEEDAVVTLSGAEQATPERALADAARVLSDEAPAASPAPAPTEQAAPAALMQTAEDAAEQATDAAQATAAARIPDYTQYQWALHNDGSISGSKPGADIGNTDGLKGSDEVIIAVMDGAIDHEHPDLADQMIDLREYGSIMEDTGCGRYGYDATGPNTPDSPAAASVHGTHCAGVIGAEGITGGTAGAMENVTLLSVDAFGDTESSYTSSILRGYGWLSAAKSKYKVNIRACNCSFGGDHFSMAERMGIRALVQNDIIPVYSSGNDNVDIGMNASTVAYTKAPGALWVNAINAMGEKTVISNYSKPLTDIFAPGGGIFSTVSIKNSLFNAFTAAPQGKTIVYEGFEDDQTLEPDVNGGFDFCWYDTNADNRCGAPVEIGGNHFIGEKSLSVPGDDQAESVIISRPVDLSDKVTPGQPLYLGMTVYAMDSYTSFVNAAVRGRDGTWLYLEGNYLAAAYGGEWSTAYNLGDQLLPSDTDYANFQMALIVSMMGGGTQTCIDSVGIGAGTEPYATLSGTSMAAPYVTGAFGLLCASHPQESGRRISARLEGGAVKSDAFSELCLSGGMLNVHKADTDPDPVLQECQAEGDQITLEGWFIGPGGSVTVGGQPAKILSWQEDTETTPGEIVVEKPAAVTGSPLEVVMTDAQGCTAGNYLYVPAQDTTFTDLPLPQDDTYLRVEEAQLFAGDGALYMLGTVAGEGSQALQHLWQYDPKQASWQYIKGATLDSTAKAQFGSAVVYQGELYVNGNVPCADGTISRLAKYDRVLGGWAAVPAPDGLSADTVLERCGQKLLAIGGSDADGNFIDAISVFTPGETTLQKIGAAPEALSYPNIAISGDTLITYGGSDFEYTGIENTDIFLTDLKTGASRTIAAPPADAGQQSGYDIVETLNGALLIGSVYTGDGGYTDCWSLEPAAGTWTPAGKMLSSTKSGFVSAARCGNTLYAWAYNIQTPTRQIFRATPDEARKALYDGATAAIQAAETAIDANAGNQRQAYDAAVKAVAALEEEFRPDFAAAMAGLKAKLDANTAAPPDKIVAFVTRLYKVCLEREPEAAGLNGWVKQLKTGGKTGRDVAFGFVFSDEFQSKKTGNAEFVKRLYRAFMGREAEPAGLTGWTAKLDGGMTRLQVFEGFAGSDEFTKICQNYGIARG